MIQEHWDKGGYCAACSEDDRYPHTCGGVKLAKAPEVQNKYDRNVKGVTVDVYDVLKAFSVTCPALQHAAKKVLCAGLRGHKDKSKDIREAIEALERAEQLNAE